MIDLSSYDALLLDFDGPVCHVFQGDIDPATAAQRVLDALPAGHGLVVENDDPFSLIAQVLEGRSTVDPRHLSDLLRAVELEAIQTAPPADGGLELIEAWSEKPLAIASNNSAACVDAWLTRHDARSSVDVIEGRPSDPALMKPEPSILLWAANRLHVAPSKCLFVGDSITDGEAARLAGVDFVALTKNLPHRRAAFVEEGAAIVLVDSMTALVASPS